MRTTISMIVGCVVLGMSLTAWLWGEAHDIDTSMLWTIVPIILASLFIGNSLSNTAQAAQQAATQTNGTMTERMTAAMTTARAARDAARTRQVQGDISAATTSSAETVNSSSLIGAQPAENGSRTTETA